MPVLEEDDGSLGGELLLVVVIVVVIGAGAKDPTVPVWLYSVWLLL